MRILVKQRNPFDCCVACLAMALDLTYDSAAATLGHDPSARVEALQEDPSVGSYARRGVHVHELTGALMRSGVTPVYLQSVEFWKFFDPGGTSFMGSTIDGRSGMLTSEEILQLMLRKGARSLVTLPSINNAGTAHMVVWDPETPQLVRDPSTRNIYTSLQGAMILESVILL